MQDKYSKIKNEDKFIIKEINTSKLIIIPIYDYKTCVSLGQNVLGFEVIAEKVDENSKETGEKIYASISGKVVAIDKHINAKMEKVNCVFISNDNKNQFLKLNNIDILNDDISQLPKHILEFLNNIKKSKLLIIDALGCDIGDYSNIACLINYSNELIYMLKLLKNYNTELKIVLISNYIWDDRIPQNIIENIDQKKVIKYNSKTNKNKIIEQFMVKEYCFCDVQKLIVLNDFINGCPNVWTFKTIGGESIKNSGVYKIINGTPLDHIEKEMGGYTICEQDIDDMKNDAIQALEDKHDIILAKKKETDKEKLKNIKELLKIKRKYANKAIMQYLFKNKTYKKQCLHSICINKISNKQCCTHNVTITENEQMITFLSNRQKIK